MNSDNSVNESDITNLVWANSDKATIDFSSSQDDAVLVFTNTNGNNGDIVSLGADASFNDTVNAGVNDTINAGGGDDIINANGKSAYIIGGAGNDTINLGADSITVAFNEADGDDFVTGWNSTDVISFEGSAVPTMEVNSSGQLVITGEEQTMTISGSDLFTTSTDINYSFNGTTGVARVADSSNAVTYDKDVTYYNVSEGGTLNVTTSKASTIDLSDSAVYGNIANVNAASSSGRINISGNSADNVLYGGAKATTLWGGGGNDTLVGGSGKDTFVYTSNDGNVTITGGDSNDVVDLSEFSISDLVGKYSFTSNGMVLALGEDQSLNVIGTDMTKFVLADGTHKVNFSSQSLS